MYGYDEFWKVKLQETTKNSYEYNHIIKDYFMQADIPLGFPGKKLLTFYETESNVHRTIAMLLINEDGKIYFADNIKDKDTGFTRYTGLSDSRFFVEKNVKYIE